MPKCSNLILVGPMGAGKTTVGKHLARSLALEFCDSDHEIESRAGVDIPTIFEYEGEAGFRKREEEMIAELLRQRGPMVFSTGGGAVLSAATRRILAENGYVVFLNCSVDQQLLRTQMDSNRPLLRHPNPRQRLEHLMQTREPLYREVADLVVDSSRCTSRQVVRMVLDAFRRFRQCKHS